MLCLVQMDLMGVDEVFVKKLYHRVEDLGLQAALQAHLEAKKKVEEAEKALMPSSQMRLVESLFEGTWRDLKIARTLESRDLLELELNIIKLNDWYFLTIPGELFSTLAKPLRENEKNIILGYADGYYLYFPDESAWEKNYYEASSCYLRKGEGEKMIGILLDKLKTDF